MSVINDMLQDLEQRRYKMPEMSAVKVVAGLQPVNLRSARSRLLWWLLSFLLVCILGGGIGWGYTTLHSTETVRSAAMPLLKSTIRSAPLLPPDLLVLSEQASLTLPASVTPVSPETEIESETEPGPPLLISRIELRQQGRVYDLEMEFNQPLSMPPLHYRRGDQIWLQLFDTDVARVQLPELSAQTPVREWSAYLENGSQMIRLRVEPSYRAELYQLRPELWRLSLESKPEALQPRMDIAQQSTQSKEPDLPAKPNQLPEFATQNPSPYLSQVQKKTNKFSQAEKVFAKGQWERAEKLLQEVLAEEPGHLAASLLLSRHYLSTAAIERAEPVILSALRHHPEQPELVNYFARCLLAQERLTEAGDYLLRAMRVDYAPHFGLLATIRQRQEQHPQARDYYLQALKLKPDEGAWLAGLGISQEHLGDAAGARKAYRRSLSSGKMNLTLQALVEARLAQLAQNRN